MKNRRMMTAVAAAGLMISLAACSSDDPEVEDTTPVATSSAPVTDEPTTDAPTTDESSPAETTAPESEGDSGLAPIAPEDVEAQVLANAAEAQMPPGSTIDCTDELPAEQGANIRCWWTYPADLKLPNGEPMPGGVKLGTTVSVTSVDGGQAKLFAQNDTFLTMADGSTKSPQEILG